MNVKGGSYQMEGWAPQDIKAMVGFMHDFNAKLRARGQWVWPRASSRRKRHASFAPMTAGGPS